ncbi:leucine-rich repeat protein [Campylobacter fetus]|uniref:leucine-rich repeat protein n=1 Tax=Campylobacter fetus TaxID=196 RepID=UPI0013D829B8|nr:leucine-rich repeat protein [Campylobacter fetus]
MKFQDALLSDKIFNFIDIPANKYYGNVPITGLEPQYVRKIGDYAFKDNTIISKLKMPYCTSIGAFAFYSSKSVAERQLIWELTLNFNNITSDISANTFYRTATNGNPSRSGSPGSWLTNNLSASFLDVRNICNGAFRVDGSTYIPYPGTSSFSRCDSSLSLNFKNINTIESNAFFVKADSRGGTNYSTAVANFTLNAENVNNIKYSFLNVQSSCTWSTNEARKNVYINIKNVNTIENNAFGGNMITSLSIPNKFRTRAELVRIGVGNPDRFKID